MLELQEPLERSLEAHGSSLDAHERDLDARERSLDPHEHSLDARKRCLELPERSLDCLLYTSPSPRDATLSRMPSSA